MVAACPLSESVVSCRPQTRDSCSLVLLFPREQPRLAQQAFVVLSAQSITQQKSGIRGVSHTKLRNLFGREAARGKILASVSRLRTPHLLLEERACALMNIDQATAHLRRASLLRRGVSHLRHRDVQLLSDQTDGFRKADVLQLLHKCEDIARCSATEAVEELPRGVDGE